MCGIKTTFMITQGCVAFSMEKNSSHLKNFTLTSLVALVTIIRYGCCGYVAGGVAGVFVGGAAGVTYHTKFH